ncbi:hypothetical protein MA16_Dca010071 [Dendrobium catenatum]|uniref:Uncharacterized protein n=1 Tax=Dendrobium catenatum TaxID=906689 RepID=A0A2I0X6Y1_9ASPA|nr:hypothetical protein MA16_Dca010071 [Dendrobium catenatum]
MRAKIDKQEDSELKPAPIQPQKQLKNIMPWLKQLLPDITEIIPCEKNQQKAITSPPASIKNDPTDEPGCLKGHPRLMEAGLGHHSLNVQNSPQLLYVILVVYPRNDGLKICKPTGFCHRVELAKIPKNIFPGLNCKGEPKMGHRKKTLPAASQKRTIHNLAAAKKPPAKRQNKGIYMPENL